MERKKRSKGSVWEFCYAKKNFGTFGVEMRAYRQKLVKLCTLTHAAKLVVRITFTCILCECFYRTCDVVRDSQVFSDHRKHQSIVPAKPGFAPDCTTLVTCRMKY